MQQSSGIEREFLTQKSIDILEALIEAKMDISDEIPILYWFVIDNKPTSILELGVRGGGSTRAFLCALHDLNKGQLFSVDINPCGETQQTMEKLDLTLHWHFIHHDDRTLNWNQYIDLLFIDSSHAYELTIIELTKYTPFLREKGVIFLHDVKSYGAVKEAVDYWMSNNLGWKYKLIDTTHGLGLMWRE